MTTTDTTTTEQHNKLAGARMAAGRAKAALLVARVRKGACLADGSDVTEAHAAVVAAEQKLLDCELLIETLQGRHDVAVAASREEVKQRLEEDAQEILAQLLSVGQEVDAAMAAFGELVNEKLIPLLDAVRLLPTADSALLTQLTSAQLEFKYKLLNAVARMPGCKAPENMFLKKAPWSASLPQPTPTTPPKRAA